PPGQQFGHGPIPEQPRFDVHKAPIASGGLNTSGLTSSSPPSGGQGRGIDRETVLTNTQPVNEDKRQPVESAHAPVEAPTEQDRGIEPFDNNEGEEPTPEQPADDSQGGESEGIDAMEVDHDHDDSDRDTLRKAFPEGPSMAQLEGEKRTL